jgi:catechol 2,3-dioxygenase-like lactoylglutathione lyase family enzyme
MGEIVDDILTQFESGRLTRRQALGAITALAASTAFGSAPAQYKARSINHVNVIVSDVAQSEAFYRTLLGVPPSRNIPPAAHAVDFPDGGFLSLCPIDGGCFVGNPVPGRIDHIGIGVENFDAVRVTRELEAAGVEGVEKVGPSVFVRDPDGVAVQLSSADWDGS